MQLDRGIIRAGSILAAAVTGLLVCTGAGSAAATSPGPAISYSTLYPGGDNRPVDASSLTSGDAYRWSVSAGVISPPSFTADANSASAVFSLAGHTTAHQVTFTLTDTTSGQVATVTAPVNYPSVRVTGSPWRPQIAVNDFGSGEPVKISYSGSLSGPGSVTTDPCCPSKTITGTARLGRTASAGTISATGSTFGRSTTTHLRVVGTRLAAGQAVPVDQANGRPIIAAPTLRIGADLVLIGNGGGNQVLAIEQWASPSRSAPVAVTHGAIRGQLGPHCRLVLQHSGDLQLRCPGSYTPRGTTRVVMWSSHTAGTGQHNRTEWLNDGRLAIVTHAGRVVWRSDMG